MHLHMCLGASAALTVQMLVPVGYRFPRRPNELAEAAEHLQAASEEGAPVASASTMPLPEENLLQVSFLLKVVLVVGSAAGVIDQNSAATRR